MSNGDAGQQSSMVAICRAVDVIIRLAVAYGCLSGVLQCCSVAVCDMVWYAG